MENRCQASPEMTSQNSRESQTFRSLNTEVEPRQVMGEIQRSLPLMMFAITINSDYAREAHLTSTEGQTARIASGKARLGINTFVVD
jgi:hypothetical protein